MKEERSIRANIVIISAGSLGSTKILSESNLRGLEVSSELGRNFYTNGGIFGKFVFKLVTFLLLYQLIQQFLMATNASTKLYQHQFQRTPNIVVCHGISFDVG